MAIKSIQGKNVTCSGCGWKWSTDDSHPSDKYVCHTCGRDNSNSTLKNGGWLDNYGEEANANDGESSADPGYIGEGYTDEGFDYNGAWGGQFQTGGSIPGAVGFTYARTSGSAPSNGKYAKKTLASAQGGSKIAPTKVYRDSSELNPGTKKVERNVNFSDTPSNYEDYIPNVSDIQKDAAKEFSDWYSNPITKKRIQEQTGLSEDRVNDFIMKGLTSTPIKLKSMREWDSNPDINAAYTDDEGNRRIMYDDNTSKNSMFHEYTHAGNLDLLLGNSLKKVIGSPFEQKGHWDDTSQGWIPEDARIWNKHYISQPFEAYGNFAAFRKEMGIKPGEQITPQQVEKLVKQKKLQNHPFYKNFDTKNIVKALNTVAYNSNNNEQVDTAQNGKEMQYYQEGLDFQPKSISKNGGWLDSLEQGGIIKDDLGQWAHPGEITEINSNDITMEGVPYDVLGVSDEGDTKLMKPGKNYKFKGKKVLEFPIAKNGFSNQLDQLTNFSNYNKKEKGGWLDNI